MRRISRYLPLFVLLLFFVRFAAAQSSVDFGMSFGAAQDKANTTGIDQNTFLSCNPATSSTCSPTPALSGFFLGFGGDLMLWKHFGVGGEANFQTSKQNYAVLQPAIPSVGQPQINLQSRVTFYDFNAIAEPVSAKRVGLRFYGGIGGANIRFYENATGSNALVGNFNSSQYAASSNHFQVHGGVGVELFLTEHFFIRPEFDVHWVNNFIQFGRDVATREAVWVGYSFGER